jgi:diacylglycerol kinase (ATP)
MPATVILNPYSNRWEAGRRAPEIEEKLQRAGIDYILHKTERPHHGTELARLAVEQGDFPIIAVGGDGAVTEVVNAILQATPAEKRPAGPLGIIPFGTANDLTDVIGIPRDLDEAINVIAKGATQNIDVGMVNGHYFDNNSAIGLEPMVTIENIRLTWLRGVIRYLVSAVITILKRPTWQAKLEWDTGEYEGSITLVSVGNTRRTGGVFYMTPNASYKDGFLDFVFAPALSRLRLFQLLPKSQTGDHVHEPEVHEHRTRKLVIHTQTPTAIQADGELIATEATEIIYEVLPGSLMVFMPQISIDLVE